MTRLCDEIEAEIAGVAARGRAPRRHARDRRHRRRDRGRGTAPRRGVHRVPRDDRSAEGSRADLEEGDRRRRRRVGRPRPVATTASLRSAAARDRPGRRSARREGFSRGAVGIASAAPGGVAALPSGVGRRARIAGRAASPGAGLGAAAVVGGGYRRRWALAASSGWTVRFGGDRRHHRHRSSRRPQRRSSRCGPHSWLRRFMSLKRSVRRMWNRPSPRSSAPVVEIAAWVFGSRSSDRRSP